MTTIHRAAKPGEAACGTALPTSTLSTQVVRSMTGPRVVPLRTQGTSSPDEVTCQRCIAVIARYEAFYGPYPALEG